MNYLAFFATVALLLITVDSISLREVHNIRQRVREDLREPHILPSGTQFSPVLQIDPETQNVRVLRPRPALTLEQVFKNAQARINESRLKQAGEGPLSIFPKTSP